jgi:hypothetical protein
MRTAEEIAADNDLFRTTMLTSRRHKIVLTQGVLALRERDPQAFDELLAAVKNFDEFTEDNDPHQEHDFGSVDVDGVRYFWKIDYYDSKYEFGEDPYEGRTNLVLTIMEAGEY